MTRTAIAIVLALAACALLIRLSLDSRPIPIEAHIAQHTFTTDIHRAGEDFISLIGALDSARRADQAPGQAARTLLERIEQRADAPPAPLLEIAANSYHADWLESTSSKLAQTLDTVTATARELLAEQTDYAGALALVRESGATVIQRMRDAGLERGAVEMLRLVVAAQNYAGSGSAAAESDVRMLLATLNRDQRVDARSPRAAEELLAAIATIVDRRAEIDRKLATLRTAAVSSDGAAAARAVADLHDQAVKRVDQARILLAAFSLALLLAVGFIAMRLHLSYRELNRSNADLAELNQSLEARVAERTEALAGTIADLKESQVQLVQAEKMSSLGQLVAGISHEINTPLLYLANNAELVRERLELVKRFVAGAKSLFEIRSEDCRDRAEYQQKFVAALKDLKTLMRDDDLEASVDDAQDLVLDSIGGLADLTEIAQSLKDFSRLDRAPVARFNVNAGLDKTLLIARNVTKQKAEIMRFYGEIPEIECSPSQINQVFLNLITNAAQAIETHGDIAITTKLYDPEHIAVRISDTGCGIPAENLSKICDPFFTTKEVGTGTGLGLSIVDEIVRAHGGRLEVESEVGKGSTFTVILPIKRAATRDELASGDASQPAPGHGEPQPLAEAV